MERVLTLVVARQIGGGGHCAYRGCEIALTAEAFDLVGRGGWVVCQQCMAELLRKHPDQIAEGSPDELKGPTRIAE